MTRKILGKINFDMIILKGKNSKNKQTTLVFPIWILMTIYPLEPEKRESAFWSTDGPPHNFLIMMSGMCWSNDMWRTLWMHNLFEYRIHIKVTTRTWFGCVFILRWWRVWGTIRILVPSNTYTSTPWVRMITCTTWGMMKYRVRI